VSYDKFTYFYGPNDFFSQWNQKHNFVIKDMTFHCTEQWMMFGKATLFEDYETADLILDAGHPKQCKELGRKVRGFRESIWNEHARNIVYFGNLYKFQQNEEYLVSLYETKGTLLVEASPYDRVWGVGLSQDDPRILDRANWLGTNWLGEVLTKLRDDIFSFSPE
jgi:ribA/ribD-fused uncharacterized protein